MTGCLYTPAAQADLDDIWEYTVENWGVAQAKQYLREIAAACADVLAGKRQSRAIDDIRAGYRKFLINSHMVYFRFNTNSNMEIIRILHLRMDVERHLR